MQKRESLKKLPSAASLADSIERTEIRLQCCSWAYLFNRSHFPLFSSSSSLDPSTIPTECVADLSLILVAFVYCPLFGLSVHFGLVPLALKCFASQNG
jgi:hypothetical protein